MDYEHNSCHCEHQEEENNGENGGESHVAADDTGPVPLSTRDRRTVGETDLMIRSVRFITRRNCHICTEAQPLVADRADRKGWVFEVVDVDDSGLAGQYGNRVPVVLLDGHEVLSGRFGRREVRRTLR